LFSRLRRETPVGCAPRALRGVRQALEHAILETAAAWEHEGMAEGEVRSISGAVDATFLARMMLVVMDLDVHFISSLPVLQRPACMAWADTRCGQIVGAESSTRPVHGVVDDVFD